MSKKQRSRKNKKWTLEKCIESARCYLTPFVWSVQDPHAYWAANRNGWSKPCTVHMIQKFNQQNVLEIAKKSDTIIEWRIKNLPSYMAAVRLNCATECTIHMRDAITGLNLQDCIEASKDFGTHIEWIMKDKASFMSAKRNWWLKLCDSHMTNAVDITKRLSKEYTIADCRKISKYFDCITHWGSFHNVSLMQAKNSGWLVRGKVNSKPKIVENKNLPI